ncbi:FBP C-terminal treble-clef zinc-finger [Terribacillus aidingensis]|uniref:FBP C-terminal treble-clef zinc-finger n=1 Tax=Terribacillus aidingensis TaxID=586416 RepID=A0A285MZ06_9BACI|nr:FusB/FusC family EF-G-binding protein [Terribacillus aidingensis]SNZ02450.1 FBP C-terminal treble-clef zinc-finger [Terribacillus aidingensis]
MQAFIRNDQYNNIKEQAQQLVNSSAAVKDIDMIYGLRSLAEEKIKERFEDLSEEQAEMLERISTVRDEIDAELYLAQLRPSIKPFPAYTEQQLRDLFPKVKQLYLPKLSEVDLEKTSYLGWNDNGQQAKYLVAPYKEGTLAARGTFTPSSQPGICTICNKLESVGLFMADPVSRSHGTYVKRGNYVCRDSAKCNRNLTDIHRFYSFLSHLHAS